MAKQHVLVSPGRYDQVKEICAFVVQGATEAGLDEKALFHVELACDEACTNIIEHAYGGEDKGEIRISWEIDHEWFVITIEDDGRSFNPQNVPKPQIPEKDSADAIIEQLPVGGLGIHFMRKLMDVVEFSFNQQNGNTLLLKKKRKQG